MDVSITFKPTGNHWDAPITIYEHADGHRTITRDDIDPNIDSVSRIHFPHGVVLRDGYMSPFDVARQPVGQRTL